MLETSDDRFSRRMRALRISLCALLAGLAATCFSPSLLHAQVTKSQSAAVLPDTGFAFEQSASGFLISLNGQRIADYHRVDSRILRPFFSSVQTLGGVQVTRSHPPIEGQDPTDHDTMHPGLWMAFGDLSGQDFWRNKAKMQFDQELQAPRIQKNTLTFADAFVLLDSNDQYLGQQKSHFELRAFSGGWRIRWTATFIPQSSDIVFGDQEEMGLGVRVATSMTEKNGGRILSSSGAAGASATWGKMAEWCSYSGAVEGKPAGIVILPSPRNFHASWWHNRDYGLMVANPFGQSALGGGKLGKLVVKKEDPLVLSFDVIVHDGQFSEELTKAE